MREGREEIQDGVGNRVGTRADREADNFGTPQGNAVISLEDVEGRVRVRRRLEVRDESGGIEATRYLEDPVVDLRVKILEPKEAARTETSRVAEDASA